MTANQRRVRTHEIVHTTLSPPIEVDGAVQPFQRATLAAGIEARMDARARQVEAAKAEHDLHRGQKRSFASFITLFLLPTQYWFAHDGRYGRIST